MLRHSDIRKNQSVKLDGKYHIVTWIGDRSVILDNFIHLAPGHDGYYPSLNRADRDRKYSEVYEIFE